MVIQLDAVSKKAHQFLRPAGSKSDVGAINTKISGSIARIPAMATRLPTRKFKRTAVK